MKELKGDGSDKRDFTDILFGTGDLPPLNEMDRKLCREEDKEFFELMEKELNKRVESEDILNNKYLLEEIDIEENTELPEYMKMEIDKRKVKYETSLKDNNLLVINQNEDEDSLKDKDLLEINQKEDEDSLKNKDLLEINQKEDPESNSFKKNNKK